MAMTSPLTIGLLWHSATSDNLGVGALTVAQIAIVEALAAARGLPVRFVILGWRDPRPAYVAQDNVTRADLRTRDLVRPGGLWQAVRGCDLVLDISAGDSFSDIYGGKRFLKNIASKAVVLAAGRPLILSPQTIGPFKAPWAKRLAFSMMRRATARFARDQISIDILRQAGFRAPVELASDVALKLPFDRPAPRTDGLTRVGLNVSGLLMNGGYTGQNMFGLTADYPALIRRLIAIFAAREGCELHLIAHVISDRFAVEDDYRACKALAEEATDRVVLAPRFESPSAAKSYIAGMDFFMGARMHACIAALSAGVPVVPMAYSRKFAGLFGALGYNHTVDCTAESTEAIEGRIMIAFEARARLAEEVQTALTLGLERLAAYETMLGAAMEQAWRDRQSGAYLPRKNTVAR
jgi:colanic acid/amylovoran biosynthesis protein